MSGGRTTWWPKDAAWHRRERIVALGEEFGSAGPNVMDVLSAWAQEQRAGGNVRGGFRILAREAFVDTAEARRIVERAAAIGALDDLDVTVSHGQFVCRVSGWSADQERGRAAVRKADSRSGSHGESRSDHQSQSGNPDPGETESRSVTPGTQPDPTRPNQETETPPTPPEGGRERDRQRYEEQITAWAEHHFPAADPRRVAALAAMLAAGPEPVTAEGMREYGRQHPVWALESQEPAAA